MKLVTLISTVASATLLVVMQLTVPVSTPAVAQGTASISGRVTYTDGRPVPRYPVEYRPASDAGARDRARTDADGRYVISGLDDGVYWVGFFHPSRVPAHLNPRAEELPDVAPELRSIGAPKGQRVIITGGKSADGVDFVLIDDGSERQDTAGIETGPGGLEPPLSGRTGADRSGSWAPVLAFLSAGILATALGVTRMIARR